MALHVRTVMGLSRYSATGTAMGHVAGLPRENCVTNRPTPAARARPPETTPGRALHGYAGARVPRPPFTSCSNCEVQQSYIPTALPNHEFNIRMTNDQ